MKNIHPYLYIAKNKMNEAHMKIKFEVWYKCLAYEVNALLIYNKV